MRRLAAAVTSGAVLVGVAGSVLAQQRRGTEGIVRSEQSGALKGRQVLVLSAAKVEAVVALAPEPVAAARRTPPARVRCLAGGEGGPLRNPWSCTVRYRSGTRAHYRVVVQPNGRYRGAGTGIITGCCVDAPTLH